jgi:hypothetical protein
LQYNIGQAFFFVLACAAAALRRAKCKLWFRQLSGSPEVSDFGIQHFLVLEAK